MPRDRKVNTRRNSELILSVFLTVPSAAMSRDWALPAVVAMVVVTLALTLAHPHPHSHPHPHTHGTCMVAGRSLEFPRHVLGGGLQHCLRGVKPLKRHRSILKYCKEKVKKQLITDTKNFKNLLDPDARAEMVAEAWEGVAACLVERLELEADDGTLDTKKLVMATAGMGGKDMWKVKYMRATVITCASNTTAENATEQLKEVMECVRAHVIEFCESKTDIARRWLQSTAEESACSPVLVPPEPMEACLTCAKDLDVPKAACGEEMNDENSDENSDEDGEDNDGDDENESRNYFPDSLQLSPEEATYAVRLCARERLGWYRPTEGYLYTELSDAIANFSGWEDIPQALENVTQAILDCAPPYEGDAQVQDLLWSSCFMRTFFNTCGFRSNLTALLIPGFHHAMDEEVKQLMRGLVQLTELGEHDDYYDDDDDEDAELVDAGLLERSMMLDEDDEGPRVRSASMKDFSKKDSGMMDKNESRKTEKQGATTESLESPTNAPSEDASSDMPEESDPSGTPPADPSSTPPIESPEEGSGSGLHDTSDKPLPEPSPEAPEDVVEEEK